MADNRLSRRQMLAVLGGTGTLAGCAGTSEEKSQASPTASPPTRTESTTVSEVPDETNTGSEEPTEEPSADLIYVSPDGDDSNPGTEEEPFQTILRALDTVQPGETVYLLPGEYRQRIVTINPAEPDNPITLTGSKDAVVRPTEQIDKDFYYPVKIQHSHYRITGFTINGLHTPDAPKDPKSYTQRLIQIAPDPETSEYLENVVFAPHGIGNTRRALVSVVHTKDSEFGPFKMIGPAGVQYLYGDVKSHIGEILYIGQPLQVYEDGAQGYHWDTYDQTRNLHIHHIDNSEGYHHAEMVDCKDGTRNITIEYCTDAGGSANNDPFSPQSIHVRGHDCTIRWNHLANGNGNGVEVYKPGEEKLFPEFGFTQEVVDKIATDNEIYGNEIYDFGGKAIALDDETKDAQRHICGNDIRGDTNGDPEKACSNELPDGDSVGHTGGDSPWG